MKAQTRNQLLALGAIVVALGGVAWIASGKIGDNLVYYWKPSELLANGDKAYGATIRLGGVVMPGSLDKSDPSKLKFSVADSRLPTAVKVPVISTETPPQMFREGVGVVVEGTYDKDNIFRSNRLMVNHDNNYRAPTDGGTMPDEMWKESLSQMK
jgi:cytochrome c-type biogenesis protein CcmE